MGAFFTVTIFDKDDGPRHRKLEKAVTDAFPADGINCLFGKFAAEMQVKTYAMSPKFQPSVGAFVIEVDQMGGDMVDIVRSLKKTKTVKHVPIILYTDSSDMALIDRCREAGSMTRFRRNDLADLIKLLSEIKSSGIWMDK